LPITVSIGLLLFHDWIRFGSPLDTGYDFSTFQTPILKGASILLLSPSFGLVWFFPAALLAIGGSVVSYRRTPLATLAIAGLVISQVVLYARWWAVWGALWGPRFLVPVIPALALLLLPVASGGRLAKASLAVAGLAGVSAQLVTVCTGFWTQVAPTWAHL